MFKDGVTNIETTRTVSNETRNKDSVYILSKSEQGNITQVENELYSSGLVWKIFQTGAVGKSSSTSLILCYIFTKVNFLYYVHKFVLFKLVKGSLSYQN